MKELEQYIERELHGADSYFAVERSADELELLLETQADVCRDVADDLGAGAQNMYLVGAGGSLANLRPLKPIFDRLLRIPVEVYSGDELVGSEPRGLGSGSLVVLASNSGEVHDTLSAARFAKQRGARTIAVVGNPDPRWPARPTPYCPFTTGTSP